MQKLCIYTWLLSCDGIILFTFGLTLHSDIHWSWCNRTIIVSKTIHYFCCTLVYSAMCDVDGTIEWENAIVSSKWWHIVQICSTGSISRIWVDVNVILIPGHIEISILVAAAMGLIIDITININSCCWSEFKCDSSSTRAQSHLSNWAGIYSIKQWK